MVNTPGLLPGAKKPLPSTLPLMTPAPPRSPGAFTVVLVGKASVPIEPLTNKLPSLTVVVPV